MVEGGSPIRLVCEALAYLEDVEPYVEKGLAHVQD
jgi:hypothetical protein